MLPSASKPFTAVYSLAGHEALNTEKDIARASADVQSSQKTLAQRLPHFFALPQGNALRSIFLRPRASCFSFTFLLSAKNKNKLTKSWPVKNISLISLHPGVGNMISSLRIRVEK